MSDHSDDKGMSAPVRELLSWTWQVLAVLILSLALIFLGSQMASEPPSTVEVVRSQHCTYTSGEGGTVQACRLSYSEPENTSEPS